jgi:hypothetical protein
LGEFVKCKTSKIYPTTKNSGQARLSTGIIAKLFKKSLTAWRGNDEERG